MSKTFCTYPWRHLYVHTTGHQKICCLSNENITKNNNYNQFNLTRDSLFDCWNSEYMKKIRTQMLQDKEVTACQRCYDQESKGLTSMRIDDNKEYYKSKTIDGTTSLVPSHIELHFGNICNLSCKMCSQMFSHSIGKELLKIGEQDPDFLTWIKKNSGIVNNWTGELDVVYDWFKNEKVKKEIFEFVSTNVTALSIVGGEPTAIKEFYELLEYCYQKNTLQDKSITVFTNCTNVNTNLTQWLSKIKDFTIYASIDGLKERNNYIRFPSRWEKILESLDFYKSLIQRTKNSKIVFGPAIQLLNIDHITEMTLFFEEFALKNKLSSNIWWTGTVTSPKIFDYTEAPLDYKKYCIDSMSKNLNKVSSQYYKEQIITHIEYLHKTLHNPTDKNLLTAFVRYNDIQDKFRKCQTWRTLLPQLEKSLLGTTGIKTIL